MMTSFECSVKADELDRLGHECLTRDGREAFARMVKGWRRTASLARRHEEWEATNLAS